MRSMYKLPPMTNQNYYRSLVPSQLDYMYLPPMTSFLRYTAQCIWLAADGKA